MTKKKLINKSELSIPRRVSDAIRSGSLFGTDACLIVAVSGGADSVALLDILSSLPCYSFRLVVAHLNHLLRGQESDEDEMFVRRLAQGYGLPFELSRVDVRSMAKNRRISLEEAGREARYSFFEELRTRHKADAIAVAHHADDQAETLLIRLLRGSGITGLSGMSADNGRMVVRPLLGITRKELRNWLDARGLAFREDSSNTDRSILRNRIRHELLPMLAGYNPAISQRLAATAQLMGDTENLLAISENRAWVQLATEGVGWVSIPRHSMLQEPREMRMRLYRKAIRSITGDLSRMELCHCQALDLILSGGQTGKRIVLPKNLCAELTADHLIIAIRNRLSLSPPPALLIESTGSYELSNGLSLIVERSEPPENWSEITGRITYVSAELAPFPWEVRPLARGERMEPLGMKGSRLASDILVDARFPRYLRNGLPMLTCNGRPLWLAGVRRTGLALVRPGETDVLKVTLTGCENLPLFP